MHEEPTKSGKKPKGSGRRLYTDENPKDTIPIKFATMSDVRTTIRKLEKLYKSGERKHIRISQVAQVLEQRLRFIKDAKDRHNLAKRYKEFLKQRTKLKNEDDRKKLKFKIKQ